MSQKTEALFEAIENGNVETVNLILESGYEYEYVSSDFDNSSYCPVCLCCIYERFDILKILLEKGANPDGFCTRFRVTYCPIIFCSKKNWINKEDEGLKIRKKMMKLLLIYGARCDFYFKENEETQDEIIFNFFRTENEEHEKELKRMIEKYSSVNLKPAK